MKNSFLARTTSVVGFHSSFAETLRSLAVSSLAGLFLLGCSTSPLGRKQIMLVPDSQMDQMGVQSFQQMKAQTPVETDAGLNTYIKCVVTPLTQVVNAEAGARDWEIVVFKDPTANAFALPGGKIGVHTGLMKVAKNDAQIAAVLGHEIGHVLAKHGNERVSENIVAQGGLAALGATMQDSSKSGLLLGLLGAGAQFGVLLPHSRSQESEADIIGLQLMSKAGFDPHQSVNLWQNMIADSGGQAPPEWLSTHPASENRIANLQSHMGEVVPIYQQAQAAGKTPKCTRPPGI